MAKKEKLFRLTIELEEVMAEESSYASLFINGQICSGINQIKATLDRFNTRLNEFVDNVLIPNQKKREKN